MKIAIASDHAGFVLKSAIGEALRTGGHDVFDFGCRSVEAVDLPDFTYPAAMALSCGEVDRAVLVDGAGYPSAMIANCLWGVYAAVANDLFSARLAREHSDANALCLGGKLIGDGVALEIVKVFLETKFLGGKYDRRVEKVHAIAERHRKPPSLQPVKVLTLEDLREAVQMRRSILLDDQTILTPGVLDAVSSWRP